MTLRSALEAMSESGLTVQRVSRFFATPCFPAGAGPDYVNACCAVTMGDAEGGARKLLHKLHRIEADFGRARVQRWGSRTLDLDLLAAGAQVLPDLETHAAWRDLPPEDQARTAPDQLILPHPRLQDRAFVLVPLMDIAPDWVHPILRQSVTELCGALSPELRAEPVPL